MIPTIQNWANIVYQNYSTQNDEVGPKLGKVIVSAPALLALGAQAFGSLPLQPILVTIAVADAAFHYAAMRNPEFCQKAKKYEWLFYGVRLAALAWSLRHLFQTLSTWLAAFPLTVAPILKMHSTRLSQRWTFVNGGPFYSGPCDWIALSSFLGIAGIAGMGTLVDKILQCLEKYKEELTDVMSIPQPKDISIKIASSQQHLPKAPLWVAVLQQVVYSSLAIFSKSHLVFAGLSGLNLYTLYESVLYTRTCLRQMNITMNFNSNRIKKHFEYKERFTVQENIKKEVSSEIKRLCREAANFKSLILPQSNDGNSCIIHCRAMPALVSNTSSSEQISGSQLYLKSQDQKLECNVVPLAYKTYQEGTKIQVQIDKCDKNSKILKIPLDNDAIVKFSNVCTSLILKMGAKTIDAIVEGVETKNGQFYLYCRSTMLPKAEKLTFVWDKGHLTLKANLYICEKEKGQAPCSKCESVSKLFYYEACEPSNAVCKKCIKNDFENRVKSFGTVNDATIEEAFPSDYINYNVYADKEQLPEGSTLDIKVPKGYMNIHWLEYPVRKIVNVQLQNVDEGSAIGLLPDQTMVVLPNVDLEKASEILQAQKTIDAQIFFKQVIEGRLVLHCISKALPPQSITLNSKASKQLNHDTPLHVQCSFDLKPSLSNQDATCNICLDTSEILFYGCATEKHTTCIPCVMEQYTTKLNELKILNFASRNVINQEGQSVKAYSFCYDKESLPSCPECKSPVIIDDGQLSARVENEKVEVLLLNYKVDDIVQFHIEGFFDDGMPYGELDDGTLVVVKDLQPDQALNFQRLQTPINAKIQKKIVENGQLCLICGFISES